jgi:hypothetical protein
LPSVKAVSNASPESLREENSGAERRLSKTPIPRSATTISSPLPLTQKPASPELEASLCSKTFETNSRVAATNSCAFFGGKPARPAAFCNEEQKPYQSSGSSSVPQYNLINRHRVRSFSKLLINSPLQISSTKITRCDKTNSPRLGSGSPAFKSH